jgi:hypothetical protein
MKQANRCNRIVKMGEIFGGTLAAKSLMNLWNDSVSQAEEPLHSDVSEQR